MKKLTTEAGKDSLNYEKDIDSLKSHLYGFLFTLRKLPEYDLKWAVRKELEPHVRQMIKILEG